MAITQEKLIELLNKDLELEYSAAIQYINHAAVMTGAAYGDVIKELFKERTGKTVVEVYKELYPLYEEIVGYLPTIEKK